MKYIEQILITFAVSFIVAIAVVSSCFLIYFLLTGTMLGGMFKVAMTIVFVLAVLYTITYHRNHGFPNDLH